MVVDVDDHHPGNDAMPKMLLLKEINPAFKVTLFAVPGMGGKGFWDAHPEWVELVSHGWMHPDPYECAHWTYERMQQAVYDKPDAFVDGWKSPGWQVSDQSYRVLVDQNWWIADQHLEDARRPAELPTYFYEDGDDRIHLHVQDVCGNGLNESWDWLVERVASATEFKFCSESLSLGSDPHDSRKREVSA